MSRKLFAISIIFICRCHMLYAQADARASSIADSVMLMMGGSENWNQTHYLHWNFFNHRSLWWDKYTGDVRIEIPSKKLLLLSNINSGSGSAFRNGTEIKERDSVDYYNQRAFKIWANDSYWLIMPFKLKDPGVDVKFLGDAKDLSGVSCFVLELTFNAVGVTPANKYHVYVNRSTYLVSEFDYYARRDDTQPAFRDAWSNYRRYGTILLADDRGTDGRLTDITVTDAVPDSLFMKP